MSDIFSDTEIQESPESYNYDDYSSESYDDDNYSTESYDEGNCPPGHYISIQAGGNGHSVGDNCGCEGLGPEANIGFIIPLLILSAFIIIVKSKTKRFIVRKIN